MTIFGIHAYITLMNWSVSPYVMIVTWWTASGIILHHWSIAYELSIYCSSLIYFSVANVTITIKPKLLPLLLPPLPLLSYYFATKYFAADINFPGVVELKTQLLILENILWLPLCRINKFGLNTLASKTVVIPYTCGLSALCFAYKVRRTSTTFWAIKMKLWPRRGFDLL